MWYWKAWLYFLSSILRNWLSFVVLRGCFSCFALCATPDTNTHALNVHSPAGKTTALWQGCEDPAKRLLGDGSWAIPWTGGRGRELLIEATPATSQARTQTHTNTNAPNSLRKTTFTSTFPSLTLTLFHTHTPALVISPALWLFFENVSWS